VHSWAGFCNGNADVWSPLDTVVKNVIPYGAKVRMCDVMLLVIDVVGTLSADFLKRLDLVLRAVRRWPAPFGGLTLLVAGDFLQLAPPFGSYVFLSDVWGLVFGNRVVILKTNWRQMCDPQMLGLLLWLQTGQHTDADMALLATRRTAVPPPDVMCLFCHTLGAPYKNVEELRRLPGPSNVFEAVDKAARGSDLLSDGRAPAVPTSSVFVVRADKQGHRRDANIGPCRRPGRSQAGGDEDAGAARACLGVDYPLGAGVDAGRGRC